MVQLSPDAQHIRDAADNAHADGLTEEQFDKDFDALALARSEGRKADISAAVDEIKTAGLWPWG